MVGLPTSVRSIRLELGDSGGARARRLASNLTQTGYERPVREAEQFCNAINFAENRQADGISAVGEDGCERLERQAILARFEE